MGFERREAGQGIGIALRQRLWGASLSAGEWTGQQVVVGEKHAREEVQRRAATEIKINRRRRIGREEGEMGDKRRWMMERKGELCKA